MIILVVSYENNNQVYNGSGLGNGSLDVNGCHCITSTRNKCTRRYNSHQRKTEQLTTMQKIDEKIEEMEGEEQPTTNGIF